jgi:D-lactate dehydrogenase
VTVAGVPRAPSPDLLHALGLAVGPERVLARPLDRLVRSVDASIYRLIPEAVVRPRDLAEVRALLEACRAQRRCLTFRTAGTSLSGQAVTEGVLVELAPFWNRFAISAGGSEVWTQPGVVGGLLNRLLAPHGRRLGPDPASIDAAMMGGIVANNSSGMLCGTGQNAYRTLVGMTVMLADGAVVDTRAPEAEEVLRGARPALYAALAALRDEVRADAELVATIRRRFARKNTTGYSLNAFLDFDPVAQILARLMVGSQGTLGFVADVTLRTVAEPPARATALLFFADLVDAGAAVAPLAAAGAAALEIMDASSLRSQAAERRYPFPLGARTAALLVELREADPESLAAAVERARAALGGRTLLAPADFATDARTRDEHWRLRRGLYPSVGALRPPGTAVLMEDVAVPVERLAECIADLRLLFDAHGFPEAIVFGHAKDGNLHVAFAGDFESAETVARYGDFMQALADLVVGTYDGSLKAEHGSGRNMAAFVRQEWGDRGYEVMRRVKDLLDPEGLLNPDVVLSDDPLLHLRNLKPMPAISPTADRCIECGFCEPRCPSRTLTLSPRQRIVATREAVRLGALDTGEARAWRASLLRDFAYEGDLTCARDSMCATSCPVKIDTGALMKELAGAARSARSRRLALAAARRFRLVAAAARGSLRAASALRGLPGGAWLVHRASAAVHRAWPTLLPALPPSLALPRPAPALPRPPAPPGRREVVYFPSCLTRIVGPLPGEEGVPTAAAMVEVLGAAGFGVRYPEGLSGLCCGMPFGSRSLPEAAGLCAERAGAALWAASDGGRLPVVTDASPCAGTLGEAVARLAQEGRVLRAWDFASFWAREVLPAWPQPPRRRGTAVLHPTCTLVKMGGLPDLLAVASAHSERVAVPASAECCGFAGDRGFLVPELTASATAREAEEVRALAGEGAGLFSTCRTCEIGMSRAVGRPYRSLAHLVHDALRA